MREMCCSELLGYLLSGDSLRNRCHPPPVDEAPSRSQVDEPSTRRRLRSVPPPPLADFVQLNQRIFGKF